MTNKPILFVTSNLSRGIVSCARAVAKRGFSVAVASPASKNAQYLLEIPHLRLCKFGIFGKQFLFQTKGMRDYIKKNNPIIHTFDDISYKLFATRRPAAINHTNLSLGIDLKIYHPDSVSVRRQAQFLDDYNIAPHQKLITVISPLGAGLDALSAAAGGMPRDDFIIALFGACDRRRAQKLIKATREGPARDKIIFIGTEQDLPSLFRASFATMSLARHSGRLLKSAVAMARPTIWGENEYKIAANIPIADDSPAAIADALNTALDLSAAAREAFESKNCAAAKEFSLDRTVEEILGAKK